ncbi:hypothetical protein H7X87_02720 [Acetobacteraceae bacterium]|nr:hypothetical protein [Candidatus Parcubacteria bacterium]
MTNAALTRLTNSWPGTHWSLGADLASREIPRLSLERIREYERATFFRFGVWRYLWFIPQVTMRIGELPFLWPRHFLASFLFVLYAAASIGSLGWSGPFGPIGTAVIAGMIFVVGYLAIFSCLYRMEEMEPPSPFFLATKYWLKLSVEKAPLMSPRLRQRARDAASIPGARVVVLALEGAYLLQVRKGFFQRYCIGTWGTGVPELDNA